MNTCGFVVFRSHLHSNSFVPTESVLFFVILSPVEYRGEHSHALQYAGFNLRFQPDCTAGTSVAPKKKKERKKKKMSAVATDGYLMKSNHPQTHCALKLY